MEQVNIEDYHRETRCSEHFSLSETNPDCEKHFIKYQSDNAHNASNFQKIANQCKN